MKATSVPSLQKIADKVGVSRATVSRALRNSPLVTQAMKVRIHRAAKAMGYRNDTKLTELMTHLRKRRGRPASLEVMAVITSMFYERYLRIGDRALNPRMAGMKEKAAALGFQIEVFHLLDYGGNVERLNKVLWSRGIRGVIVDILRSEDSHLQLDWSLFSVVSTSFSLKAPCPNRICHHYFHSMQLAYEELWKLGYRRIGLHIDSRSDSVSDHNWIAAYMYEGYHRGVKDPLKPFFYEWGNERDMAVWLQASRPDAIVTTASTVPCRDLLNRLGFRTPGDIGLAAMHVPPNYDEVAGVDQRWRLLGEVSVSTLAAQIMHNEMGIPKNPIFHQVEGIWQPGQTVCPQKPSALRAKPPLRSVRSGR